MNYSTGVATTLYLVGLEGEGEGVCLRLLVASAGSLQYQCVPNEVS